METAYIGIDVAIAKRKHLPIVICTWEENRLLPRRLRHLNIQPPIGSGNAAILNDATCKSFARETRRYVAEVCDRLQLTPARIGIDAPSAPRNPGTPRRAAEVALDRAGISCFATPSFHDFDVIRGKVARHLATGGTEDRIPHANQLWMLAGFAIFEELSRLAPCLEVFPQATVRAISCGQVHKSAPGAVETQLSTAARYTGWPIGKEGDPVLQEIGWGAPHDQLDAYLSAWVAGLDESTRICHGDSAGDAIWVPKVLNEPPSLIARSPQRPAISDTMTGTFSVVLCPACGQKPFRRWPWGWDGHAAHACAGLSSTDPEKRKSEFRQRFASHFIGPAKL